jgi:hypothetical protein
VNLAITCDHPGGAAGPWSTIRMRRTLATFAVLTFVCVGASACGKHGKHDSDFDTDPVAAYGVTPPEPDPLKAAAPPAATPETPMTSNPVSEAAFEPEADAARRPLPAIRPSSPTELTASPSDPSTP